MRALQMSAELRLLEAHADSTTTHYGIRDPDGPAALHRAEQDLLQRPSIVGTKPPPGSIVNSPTSISAATPPTTAMMVTHLGASPDLIARRPPTEWRGGAVPKQGPWSLRAGARRGDDEEEVI